MNADHLAVWIGTATVDLYDKGNKQVYIGTKGNEQLILTCDRVMYEHGLHPHVNVVWIKEGASLLLYQDILGDGQIKHSTGNLTGQWGWGENLETIWSAFYHRAKMVAEEQPTEEPLLVNSQLTR